MHIFKSSAKLCILWTFC